MTENRRLHALALLLERGHERLSTRGRRAGRAVLTLYRSYGSRALLRVRGRIVAEKLITRAAEAEPVWRNLLNAYRRFQSDELAYAPVLARYGGTTVEGVADEEGYFDLTLLPGEIDPNLLWHRVEVESSGTIATAEVLVPPLDAEFGIISDIDDTIVQTGATSLRRMIQTTLLQNAAMRLPFDGVNRLYSALHRERNPLFYVSSSPWNLYDLLTDFMAMNAIPPGAMLLQDFGLDEETMVHKAHDQHKLGEIQSILDFYRDVPFILIGDSGQRDPEIYLEVIRANRGRIRLAIIRDVTPETRDKNVAAIAEEAQAAGVEMVYVTTSDEALEPARRHGLL